MKTLFSTSRITVLAPEDLTLSPREMACLEAAIACAPYRGECRLVRDGRALLVILNIVEYDYNDGEGRRHDRVMCRITSRAIWSDGFVIYKTRQGGRQLERTDWGRLAGWRIPA